MMIYQLNSVLFQIPKICSQKQSKYNNENKKQTGIFFKSLQSYSPLYSFRTHKKSSQKQQDKRTKI